MNSAVYFVLLFISALIGLNNVDAVRCYVCGSTSGSAPYNIKACASNPPDNDVWTNCDYCSKTANERKCSHGGYVVEKDCGNNCQCDSNLCNGAPTITMNLAFVIPLLIWLSSNLRTMFSS